ncbi:MAG: hypothetical protein HY820_24885 [Acidobacteria bacterium]|nr:hypothetical protein [Acidobacteriota bacterium]
MNCEKWQEPIALLVDGEDAAPALHVHLAECAGCRELLHSLREDQSLLRSVPADDSALHLIRNRVREKLRRRRRVWWAATAGIAACLSLVLLWPNQPPPEIHPPRALDPPAVTAAFTPRPMPPPKSGRVTKRDPTLDWEAFLDEFSPPPAAVQAPIMEAGIRVPTADPDVIILIVEPATIPLPDPHGDSND